MACTLGFRTLFFAVLAAAVVSGCGTHMEPIRAVAIRPHGPSDAAEPQQKPSLTAGLHFETDSSASDSTQTAAVTSEVEANALTIREEESKRPQSEPTKPQLSDEAKILEKYKNVDPQHMIAPNLLKRALLFFHRNRLWFINKKFLTIVDYSLPSSAKRMFVVHMDSGRVESIYVAHGKGSDEKNQGTPNRFSNDTDSHASSLGAFLTVDDYKGAHGLSLRLIGLQTSNWRALFRKIVVHGADYVKNAPVKQGRSFGCFVVATAQIKALVTALRGGSLLYAGLSQTP